MAFVTTTTAVSTAAAVSTTTTAVSTTAGVTTAAAAVATGEGSVAAATASATAGEASVTTAAAATGKAATTTTGVAATTASVTAATAGVAATAAMVTTATGEGTIAPFMSAIAVVATEAMAAPAMVVSPAKPRPGTDEDAVVEIVRTPETVGSTRVGWVVVISVGTYGRRPDFDRRALFDRRTTNLDPDADLGGSGYWRKCQKHCQQSADG